MIRPASLVALACGSVIAVSGCDDDSPTGPSTRTVVGSGNVVEEFRDLSPFTGLVMASVGDVLITEGNDESLRIEADDNLLPEIISEVRRGVLTIRTASGVSLRPSRTIRHHLTIRSLDSVVLSGVGDVVGPSLTADGLASLVLTGVGDVEFGDVDAERLDVKLTGVGDVHVSGGVREQTAAITGMGRYDAKDLASDDATVTISGIGSADVRVADRLAATITGLGDVCYLGSPVVVRTITGTGTIATCALGHD